VDLGHQPAAVVAERIARGGDPRRVLGPALADPGLAGLGIHGQGAVGVAVPALGGGAVTAVRALRVVEDPRVSVALVVHVGRVGRGVLDGRALVTAQRHVHVALLAGVGVGHGDRVGVEDPGGHHGAGRGGVAGVLGHEDQLVLVNQVEAVGRRGGGLAVVEAAVGRLVGDRLADVGRGVVGIGRRRVGQEAEALAVVRVVEVLVGARVEGEARGVVGEVAGEDLVDLEGDLDELLAVPAVAHDPAQRERMHRLSTAL